MRIVIAVLLYDCETWRMTKADANSLGTFLHTCLRRIVKVHGPCVCRMMNYGEERESKRSVCKYEAGERDG